MLNSDGYENGSTLLVHFFDVFFFHDYNVKRPSYSSYVGNVVCADQKFFFACVPVRIFFNHCCSFSTC